MAVENRSFRLELICKICSQFYILLIIILRFIIFFVGKENDQHIRFEFGNYSQFLKFYSLDI